MNEIGKGKDGSSVYRKIMIPVSERMVALDIIIL